MTEFDNLDWNLSQAAAWVVYREKALVEQYANPTASSYSAVELYPSMWPNGRKQHGSLKDLHAALRRGEIEARGYHCDNNNSLAPIPKEAWADLHLKPPFAYRANQLSAQLQPWKNIRLESAAIKKYWRSSLEVDGRTRYSTAFIHELRTEVFNCNPNLGHNELIAEIEALYQKRHPNKTVPSRSTIQRHLKKQI